MIKTREILLATPLASDVLRLYFDKTYSEIKDLQKSTGKSRSISMIHDHVQSFNPEFLNLFV